MNQYLFFSTIRKRGMKMEQVARDLGISTQALYLRVEGRRNFKMRELTALIKILGMTGPTIKEIFFSEPEPRTVHDQEQR